MPRSPVRRGSIHHLKALNRQLQGGGQRTGMAEPRAVHLAAGQPLQGRQAEALPSPQPHHAARHIRVPRDYASPEQRGV